MLMTSPWAEDGKLYNAAMLLDGGEVAAVRYKHDLPNYGVFDEKRVFDAGPAPGPINFRGCAHWCAHLRGHLDRRNLRDAGRDRRRAFHRAKRLAVRA
jgi:hypothetical protein